MRLTTVKAKGSVTVVVSRWLALGNQLNPKNLIIRKYKLYFDVDVIMLSYKTSKCNLAGAIQEVGLGPGISLDCVSTKEFSKKR